MSSAGDAAPPSLATSNVTVVCSPTSIPESTSPGFGTSCGAGAFSVTVSVSLVVAPSALKISISTGPVKSTVVVPASE